MAFLEKLDRFYGTGECNRAGESLEAFLEKYNPKKYDCPSNTVDMVVVRCREKYRQWGQPLKVLMIKRGNHPSIGYWAVPGGFVELREDMDQAAARELEEETGVKGLPLQQLRTWGSYDRDPRWRVITTSYLALVEGELPVKAGDDAADALWMDVELSLEPDPERKAKSEADAKAESEAELEAEPEAKSEAESEAEPKTEAKADTEAEPGRTAEIWRLTLTNADRCITAGARVKVSYNTSGVLAQEKYELLESDKIAVDHGCIITQALLYLRKGKGSI